MLSTYFNSTETFLKSWRIIADGLTTPPAQCCPPVKRWPQPGPGSRRLVAGGLRIPVYRGARGAHLSRTALTVLLAEASARACTALPDSPTLPPYSSPSRR